MKKNIFQKIKKELRKKNFNFNSFLWGLGAVFFIFLFLQFVILFSYNSGNVEFNQHYIESLDRQNGVASFSNRIDSLFSYYTLALNNLFNNKKSEEIDFNNSEEMFSYLFSEIPYYAIVYPTEMYYYYKFSLDDMEISGNLRLVELMNGKLSMGYFDIHDQSHTGVKFFGSDEGLEVSRISDTFYKVKYNGKNVFFKLSSIWNNPPRSTILLEDEEFITKVRDESGIIFYLIFNKKSNAFYYLLDEEKFSTENLRHNGNKIYIGERTGFAYYLDVEHNRKILIGVNVFNIGKNNYFDGPFDQVYPFLNLKEKIYASYPYTKALGVDEHGNFLNREGVRVAISPYSNYVNEEDLVYLKEMCENLLEDHNKFLACLTYEEKRDFHRESSFFYPNGTLRKEEELNPF